DRGFGFLCFIHDRDHSRCLSGDSLCNFVEYATMKNIVTPISTINYEFHTLRTIMNYDAKNTALLIVDPYNDFLSEGGKTWPRIKEIAEEVGLLDNLRTHNRAFRGAKMEVATVPHRRWQKGDYECFCHPTPTQRLIMQRHSFARGE